MSEQLYKALKFAAETHKGQTRSDGRPYVSHPFRVMGRLVEVGCTDEEILTVALLHDTIEDGPVGTKDKVYAEFGQRVFESVLALSLPDGIDYEAKTAHLVDLMAHGTADTVLVKLSDRVDNLMDMRDWSVEHRARYMNQSRQMLKAVYNRKFARFGELIALMTGELMIASGAGDSL